MQLGAVCVLKEWNSRKAKSRIQNLTKFTHTLETFKRFTTVGLDLFNNKLLLQDILGKKP